MSSSNRHHNISSGGGSLAGLSMPKLGDSPSSEEAERFAFEVLLLFQTSGVCEEKLGTAIFGHQTEVNKRRMRACGSLLPGKIAAWARAEFTRDADGLVVESIEKLPF